MKTTWPVLKFVGDTGGSAQNSRGESEIFLVYIMFIRGSWKNSRILIQSHYLAISYRVFENYIVLQ